MPTLSPTMFSAGPDDSLAVIDVYGEKGSKVINELAEVVAGETNDVLSQLTEAGLLDEMTLSDMMDSLSGLASQLKVSAQSLLSGILSASSSLMSALKSLAKDIQDGILNSKLFSEIKATLGGIFKTIKNAGLSALEGIANMVNDLACSNFPFSFKDIGGLVSLAINLIKQGLKMGLDGIFGAFANCAKFDGTMLNMIAKNIAPWLLNNPSNRLLNEIARSSAGKYVFQTFPNYINEYLRKYQNLTGSRNKFSYYDQKSTSFRSNSGFPPGYRNHFSDNVIRANSLDAMNPGTSNNDYYDEYKLMFESFDLMNPTWRKDTDSNRFNGNLVTGSSPYFQRTLQAGVDRSPIVYDTSDPDNFDTSTQTPQDAYLLLVRNTPVSQIRPILKERFPYSRVKVF